MNCESRGASRFRALGAVAAVAAVTMLSQPAQAALNIFADRADWEAVLSPGYSGINLPDVTDPPYEYLGGGDFTYTWDAQFSTSSALGEESLFLLGTAWADNAFPVLSAQGVNQGGLANLLITFDKALTAFGVDYGSANGAPVKFTFSNGDVYQGGVTPALGSDVTTFFGAISSSSFTSVLITTTFERQNFLNVGGVTYGDGTFVAGPGGGAGSAPEPGAWALMLMGFGAMGAVLRRRRTVAIVAAA